VVQTGKKRKSFSYSSKKLLADKQLYLHEGINTSVTTKIVGKVVGCPSVKTGNTFHIQWDHSTLNGIDPTWLRTEIPPTSNMKTLLQEAINQYYVSPNEAGIPSRNTNQVTGTLLQQPGCPGGGVVTMPPAIVRAQAVANIRTSASSISTISGSRYDANETSDIESDSDEDDEVELRHEFYDEHCHSDIENDYNSDEEDDGACATLLNSMGKGSLAEKISQLVFRYEDVTSQSGVLDSHLGHFTSETSGLNDDALSSFTDPFQCLEQVGGLSYRMVARLTKGTNTYFHTAIKPNLGRNCIWHKLKWRDISVEEMYHFLGILLRISLSPVDGGGYKTYFSTRNKVIVPSSNAAPLEITDSAGFASQFMKLERFQQIRGAFHPEDKASGLGGNKCYQIRYVINTLNAAAKKAFKIPKDLSFDEGGIGCRSRYCPVRQYNKNKPQKFRVDFFICADSSEYFILHLDVYQGKNATNVGMMML